MRRWHSGPLEGIRAFCNAPNGVLVCVQEQGSSANLSVWRQQASGLKLKFSCMAMFHMAKTVNLLTTVGAFIATTSRDSPNSSIKIWSIDALNLSHSRPLWRRIMSYVFQRTEPGCVIDLGPESKNASGMCSFQERYLIYSLDDGARVRLWDTVPLHHHTGETIDVSPMCEIQLPVHSRCTRMCANADLFACLIHRRWEHRGQYVNLYEVDNTYLGQSVNLVGQIEIPNHHVFVRCMQFNENYLVMGSSLGHVQVWDTANVTNKNNGTVDASILVRSFQAFESTAIISIVPLHGTILFLSRAMVISMPEPSFEPQLIAINCVNISQSAPNLINGLGVHNSNFMSFALNLTLEETITVMCTLTRIGLPLELILLVMDFNGIETHKKSQPLWLR